MANDENKIILEFPATNVEIEFGETITFDNISGFLNSDRVIYDGESLTEEIAHLENDKADTTYVDEQLELKADKATTYTKTQSDNRYLGKTNPSGTGYFSLNRRGSTGDYSVSVGWHNEASAQSSFAEGESNTSSGYASHSEGYGNAASGLMAHAEGVTTESSGYGSHSEGVGTIAKHIGQHVFGAYNVADTSTAQPTAKGNYIEIVGNGTDDDRRRNARTLDWQGNEMLMGDLTFNGNKSLTGEISRLDGRITDLPEPMVLKGTLGVGGTIETLPTASAENEGWVFKCITAGTYEGLTLKVGDTVTCFNPPNTSNYYWDKTGSQDTDTDTWRNIKVNGVEKLGNGISTGAVDFEDTVNVKFEFDADGNKISATLDGIYTDSEVDDLLDDKADADNTYTKAQVDDIVYNILPDDTASGSVANFETDLALPIKSLEVDVNAVQSAGTPTPASPLPISGWSAITLDANGNTEVINLGGTYYGGHFTQDKAGHRQLVITYSALLDMGDLEWANFSPADNIFRTNVPNCKSPVDNADRKNGFLCSIYPASSNVSINGNMTDKSLLRFSGYLVLRDTSYSDYTELASGLSGGKLIYELATPIVIDLPDGTPIITLNGTNNIYADTGDTSVVFKDSVSGYVEKKIASVQALALNT